MASHQTFSDQIKHLSDQISNYTYGEVKFTKDNECPDNFSPYYKH